MATRSDCVLREAAVSRAADPNPSVHQFQPVQTGAPVGVGGPVYGQLVAVLGVDAPEEFVCRGAA